MFTGLVKDIGTVTQIQSNREGKRIRVASKLCPEIEIDDSVSINGACQTAIEISSSEFEVQAVHTTLEKTTLGSLKPGDFVNLELAMAVGDRLGGHMVQGHVNGVGGIKNIVSTGDTYLLEIDYPAELSKYIVQEGSISVDGISLTVAKKEMGTTSFTLAIIPHTWHNTVLGKRNIGDKVNLEVDIIAKYVENLLGFTDNSKENVNNSNITLEWLSSKGF